MSVSESRSVISVGESGHESGFPFEVRKSGFPEAPRLVKKIAWGLGTGVATLEVNGVLNAEGRYSGTPGEPVNGLRKTPSVSEPTDHHRCRNFLRPSEAHVHPYPKQYESRHYLRDSLTVFIRPIKREDAHLLVEFFRCLSPRTVFLRFLTNLQALPLEWVKEFTDIDYGRDVALVALEEADLQEKIIGVCRVMRKTGSTRGEIAAVVGDAWQDRGIGTILLERTIQVARELEMRTLWGLVSSDNARVIAMAEKYGFRLKEVSESGHCELELEL